MGIVIVVIMLAFVAPGVFFSLISYFSAKVRVTPIIERINLTAIEGIDRKAFFRVASKLGQEGFTHIGDFSIDQDPDIAQYVRLFTDREKVVLAYCSYVVCKHVRNFNIVFESEFEDGTEVATSNYAHPRVFKYDKKKVEHQCPKAAISALLEFHRKQINIIGQGKMPRRIPADIVKTLMDDQRKLMDKQEEFKMYKKERSGEFYRTTVYGAIYIAWNYWMNTFLRYNPQVVKIKSVKLPEHLEEQEELLPAAVNLEAVEVEVTEDTSAMMADVAQENHSDDYILARQESEKLEKQLSSGASWFYWIAGLSLINTIIAVSGSDWGFIVGLAITQIIDAIGHEIGMVGIIISLVFDVTVAGSFVVLGVFASRRHKWAFITGMVVYGLDTFLMLAAQFWLALAFHVFVLYGIFTGYKAHKKLLEAQESGGDGNNKLSGETGHERN